MQTYSPAATDRQFRVHLNRSADYIQDHFGEDLNLEKLAAVAHFSKYHFHRLFRERFGETLHKYIKRTRLESAAHRLATDANASICEVADACGFSSSQNFARAFTARFGFPPSALRKNPDRLLIRKTVSPPAAPKKKTPLAVEIKEWPSCRVAYVRSIGPYRSESNGRAIQQLLQWAAATRHIDAGAKLIGVYWSDLETTSPQNCVFDACLTVQESAKGKGVVRTQTLSGGKLAVLHCEDEWDQIPAQRDRLIREWLPASGCIRDERPFFSIYYNNPHMNRLKLAIVDMCLPIKP